MEPIPDPPSKPPSGEGAPAPRPRRAWLGTALLLALVAGLGAGLAAWKRRALEAEEAASAAQPEAVESLTLSVAGEREHRATTTSIGTVVALRSVVLQNELEGTVREVALVPGEIVEEGELLVAFDVSVEQAELAAQEARARLAQTMLERVQRASEKNGASAADVDRARAELDVARAEVERTRAVIEKKTLRAPFRARVGLADVHPGQYLEAGSRLTTLQGIDETAHVDFTVPQEVAMGLSEGDRLEVTAGEVALRATIVALDARVDPDTRNAWVRARVDASSAPPPGASVRVRVPVGAPREVVTVPVSALRKGPAGDHVFVVTPDEEQHLRAHLRRVESGPVLGDQVVIESGLAPGERVAASGSFKLREGVLVSAVPEVPKTTAAR